MKKRFSLLLALLLILTACKAPVSENSPVSEPAETAAETTVDSDIVFARRGEECQFTLVYNVDVEKEERDDILTIRSALSDALGVTIRPYDDYLDATEYEIIVNSRRRPESLELLDTLAENEYAIRTLVTEEKTSIIIAYKGGYARMCAIEDFIDNYVNAGGDEAKIPAGLDVTEKVMPLLIESGIECLRDPCVLYEDGVYYAYGTGWVCYKNTSGSLDGKWSGPNEVVTKPAECDGNQWAPEVHKYNGAYYMFTTYHSSVTGHRGCTILKADDPMGPFVEITDGQITPHDWDAIDGTFYVDPDGAPWMIFVHEWTSTDDGVGRMACAKLSDDLTHFITEPVELFRADDASWATNGVTDGCWMYTTKAGSLLMIWSNWDKYGYCVGIARSESGQVTGPWIQEDKVLYSKSMTGQYDGGHGMIFTGADGQLYLSIHSPNNAQGDRREMPVFIPIREENDTLVWDK
ncbi:MAG: glycoside hydrolase family 43 protein [Eubacteriales bacterium]